MSNNFQQTVNLREKMEQEKLARQAPPVKSAPIPAPPATPAEKKAKEIDRVYRDEEEVKQNFQKISRPAAKKIDEKLMKRIIIIAGAILVLALGAWLIFRDKGAKNPPVNETAAPVWYAITLVSGEVNYGQIEDVKANPVVIYNVYYDYDQQAIQADKEEPTPETGNIRLVKKGKESYGPSGKMLIYQAQIKGIDELSPDSKVLKAILDYEGKK